MVDDWPQWRWLMGLLYYFVWTNRGKETGSISEASQKLISAFCLMKHVKESHVQKMLTVRLNINSNCRQDLCCRPLRTHQCFQWIEFEAELTLTGAGGRQECVIKTPFGGIRFVRWCAKWSLNFTFCHREMQTFSVQVETADISLLEFSPQTFVYKICRWRAKFISL